MATAADSAPEMKKDSDGLQEKDSESSEEMHCPVCLDYYDDPKLLPCGHLACARCLRSWLRANGMPRTCPECRGGIVEEEICRLPATLTPEEICEALPTDLSMQSLVRASRKLEGPHVCEKCGQGATNLCLTCCVKLCRECRRKHAKAINKKVAKAEAKREAVVAKAGNADMGLDADHPTIPYVPLQRHRIESISTLDAPMLVRHAAERCRCQRGEDAWAVYYCNTHTKSVCVPCLRSEHSQCEIVTTEAKVAEAKKVLAEQSERLQRRDRQLQQEYELLNQKESEVERKGQVLQAELDGVMDRLLQRLKGAKDKLKNDITQSENLPAEQKLQQQSSLLQTFRANMKDLLAMDDAEELLRRFGEYSQQTMQEVEERRNAVLGQRAQCPSSCVHNPRHHQLHHQHQHQQQQQQEQQQDQQDQAQRQPVDLSALRSMTEHLNTQLEEAMDSLEQSILSHGTDAATDTGEPDAPSSDTTNTVNSETASARPAYRRHISDID